MVKKRDARFLALESLCRSALSSSVLANTKIMCYVYSESHLLFFYSDNISDDLPLPFMALSTPLVLLLCTRVKACNPCLIRSFHNSLSMRVRNYRTNVILCMNLFPIVTANVEWPLYREVFREFGGCAQQ